MKKLLRALKPHRAVTGSLVGDGRVHCPSAKCYVDFDRCLACPFLNTLNVDEQGRTFVDCRGGDQTLSVGLVAL